jgi:protein-tyrosine-phosphatase
MHRVLFICTANICRSPMAMGLLRHRTALHPDQWIIESAGTWTEGGESAALKTLQVLKKRGIDLDNFQSRILTEELLRSFYLILTMEKGHKEAIRVEFPELANRVFLLSEMIDQDYDIDDPIGKPLPAFDETAQEIDALLAHGFQKIADLSKG